MRRPLQRQCTGNDSSGVGHACTRLDHFPIITLVVNNVFRYYWEVIQSFADDDTRRVFNRERVARFGLDLQRSAQRKLALLAAASNLNDLRAPPGNRLEKLAGDRVGQHSIRINQQWRICFTWTDAGPSNVEIVDYH